MNGDDERDGKRERERDEIEVAMGMIRSRSLNK